MLVQSLEPEDWKWWVLRRGGNWSTRAKTSWSQDENEQQTQPTYDIKPGN